MITGNHNEIDVRYAWYARDQRQRRNPSRLIAGRRVKELEAIYANRYGDQLPDDDAGMSDFILAANHLAQMRGDAENRILRWANNWAPWLYWRDIDPELLAQRIAQNPRRYKADTLARLLNLTMSSRTALGITTIGAVDCTRRQRLELRRERKRVYAEARRRASGAKPRAQYEAESLSRTKPWEAMGMSRSTWYRRGKPMPPAEKVGQVQTQHIDVLLMASTDMSHTGSSQIGLGNRASKQPEIFANIPQAWVIQRATATNLRMQV